MRCVINTVKVNEHKLPPNLTLLRYLREHKKMCGTKEGCASGDCGACTVMIGSVAEKSDGNTIQYTTVNACIAPVAAFDGKHIVTIEHLQRDEQLHPAQEAMIDNHGSQCGFCTPGIVLSLACMYENNKTGVNNTSTKRSDVCKAISGNLCRCTGYRPIIDAGQNLNSYPSSPKLYDDSTLAYLNNLSEDSASGYYLPESLDQLNSLMTENPKAKLISGGTDLMLDVTQHYKQFPSLIDLSKLDEMNRCIIPSPDERLDDELVIIGAAVNYSDLEKKFAKHFPEFVDFLQRFASQQIRNRATIGGNIANASPIADTPPILLVLDTVLNIGSSLGGQRKQALKDFYLGYKKTTLQAHEYIISIEFPCHYLNHFFRFYKVSKRIEDDISSVMLAVRMEIKDASIIDARIAYGGVAATPIRAHTCESYLKGAQLNDPSCLQHCIDSVTQELKPLSDVRASSEYRSKISGNLLVKAWHEANGNKLPNLGNMEEEIYA